MVSPRCCVDISYDSSISTCCAGTVFYSANFTSPQCCGKKIIDSNIESCNLSTITTTVLSQNITVNLTCGGSFYGYVEPYDNILRINA